MMLATKSLRWQLQSYYALLLFLALGTLAVVALSLTRQNEAVSQDNLLRDTRHLLVPALTSQEPQQADQWSLYEALGGNTPRVIGQSRGPGAATSLQQESRPSGPPNLDEFEGPRERRMGPPGYGPPEGVRSRSSGPPSGGPPNFDHTGDGPRFRPRGPGGPSEYADSEGFRSRPSGPQMVDDRGPRVEGGGSNGGGVPSGPRGGVGSYSPAYSLQLPADEIEALLEDGWHFGLFSISGEALRKSRDFPVGLELDFEFGRENDEIIFETDAYRVLSHREPNRAVSVVLLPKAAFAGVLQRQQWSIVIFSLLVFVLATILGGWFIGRALRPIEAIQIAADQVAQGHLRTRIDATAQRENEIGELSEQLNQTFEQLECLFERQKRFTSDASHELRTPIAVILGYCQIALEQGRSPEQIRDAVKACSRAGERMKRLTNDLLELSRIESGELNFEFSQCSVKEIAEEALELVEPLAVEKEIRLSDELEDVEIRANGDRLWQVLVNLLNNAIRHTPHAKSITVTSRVHAERVELAVIDEGEGIPQEDVAHIFDRFYRVDHSRNRQSGGSGLGLAISETIIKAHGGSIRAESVLGEGSVFTISLPLG